MKSLWPYLKPYRRPLFLGPIFKLLEAVFQLILPLAMAWMIDVGVNQHDPIVLKQGALVSLALVVGGMIFSFSCQYMASVASQGFGTNLREAIFKKLGKLTPTAIDQIGVHSITNRATYDVNQIQLTTAMAIRLLSRAPFLCVFGVIMAWQVSPKGGQILLFALIPAAIVIYVIYRLSLPFFERARRFLDKATRLIIDLLSGVRVIRAFNRQEHERRYFAETNESLEKEMTGALKISGLMNPLTTLILNVAIFFILRAGGYNVYQGSLSEGELLALINYANQVLMALTVAANTFNLVTRSKNSVERVVEVIDAPDVEQEPEAESPELDPAAPLLEAKHIDFHYATNPNLVLEDVSFALHEGETLGILGPTGSGKTTLLDILLRHHVPSEGELYLGGYKASAWRLADWRRFFSIAPQKAVLFAGTIRSNLAWGLADRQNLSREEETQLMLAALDLAQAREFVDALPEGLDAPVARGGHNFSGGQRQRLSLARALLKDAPILIQDDSSSALDFATDAKIRQGLQRERPNLTRILVSQRVHTLMDADLILVLEGGKVIARGTHDSLLESSPFYREICTYQLQDIELKRPKSPASSPAEEVRYGRA